MEQWIENGVVIPAVLPMAGIAYGTAGALLPMVVIAYHRGLGPYGRGPRPGVLVGTCGRATQS